jgi:alkyl hydroperoxide reductase subunit AhpC
VFPPEIVGTHPQQNRLNMSWVGNFFYYAFFNFVLPPEIVATRSQQNHLNMFWMGNLFYYAF